MFKAAHTVYILVKQVRYYISLVALKVHESHCTMLVCSGHTDHSHCSVNTVRDFIAGNLTRCPTVMRLHASSCTIKAVVAILKN